MSPVTLVKQKFEDVYGYPPMGVWEAPGRVNLIGEHTDYNDGLCLPIAIPQRTWVAVAKRDDNQVRLFSIGFSEKSGAETYCLTDVAPGMSGGWVRYPLGVFAAFGKNGHPVAGCDLVFYSTVPVGAGLSSSAAIEACVAAALSDLNNLDLLSTDEGRAQLAAWCVWAENEIAGAPTGGMDQAASLRCAIDHAILLDNLDHSVTQVPVKFAENQLTLLMIDTQTKHALVDGQYGARRADCQQAADILGRSLRHVAITDLAGALDQIKQLAPPTDADRLVRRVRHVVTEIDRVTKCIAALSADDYAEVGRLFVASHDSLRDDYEVTCPELDVAVAAACEAGALGARMTGGGFGGTAIALVPNDLVNQVSTAVTKAYAQAGFNPPHFYEAVAAAPAQQSR